MEELNQKITESIPIFFFIYNLKSGEIEYLSPQFFELHQEPEKVPFENPLKKCVHASHHPLFDDYFNGLSEQNNFQGSVELKANEKLEGIEWIELNTFPVKRKETPEVSEVVGHIVNISEKKEMYEVLEKENQQINNVLNMIAHDLRAPFNRVHMIAEVLEGAMTKEELEKYADYLGMLKQQGNQSLNLIGSLLKLATLKGRTSSLDLDIHDLRELVHECINNHQIRIKNKKLRVSCDLPSETVKVKADAVLFQQVLFNLVSNAIKYTPQGGELNFSVSYEGEQIVLLVQDSGVGIPEKHQRSLFEGLASFRRRGLEGEESTGLGLFICSEIVKIHDGTIDLESREGEGTRVKVSLPRPELSAAYY